MRGRLLVAGCGLLVAYGFARAQMVGLDGAPRVRAFVTYAAEAQTVAAGRRGVVELRFRVVDGFHVNSHTPGQEMLIATTLTLLPADGVKESEPEYPAGQAYAFAFDPADKLNVYAGEFTVRLPVVATAGEHAVEGSLKYQACDNASCYPPRTVPVKVLFNAK